MSCPLMQYDAWGTKILSVAARRALVALSAVRQVDRVVGADGLDRKIGRDRVDEGRRVAGAEDAADVDVGEGGIHMDLPQGIAVHAFYDIHQRLVVKEHLAGLPT